MTDKIKKGGKPADEHHLSLETMHQYLEDNLPVKEMHHVERHLLDCELCADALEGIGFLQDPQEAESSVNHLKRKIRKRSLKDPVIKRKRKIVPLPWKHVSVAAATIIMVVGSILVFRLNTPKQAKPSLIVATQPKATEQESPANNREVPVYTDAPVPSQKPSQDKEKTPTIAQAKPKVPAPAPSAKQQGLLEAEENVSLSPEVAIDQIEEQVKSEESVASNDNMPGAPREVIAEAKREKTTANKDLVQEKRMPMPSGAVGITQNFITVAGKVIRASDSTAIQGAVVSLKNTTKTAVTDYRGRFSMAVPPNSTLLVNVEGMSEQEITVSGRKTLEVALRPEGEESIADSTAGGVPATEEEDNLSFKPQPADGAMKYRTYLKKNLQYPAEAKKNNIEGTVRVEFLVQKDGKLTDFTIRKGLGYGCDEEAIRLIKEGPVWKPAKFSGQPVERKITVFVPFKL